MVNQLQQMDSRELGLDSVLLHFVQQEEIPSKVVASAFQRLGAARHEEVAEEIVGYEGGLSLLSSSCCFHDFSVLAASFFGGWQLSSSCHTKLQGQWLSRLLMMRIQQYASCFALM